MVEGNTKQQSSAAQVERDYETYKLLLGLWQSENPIKTNKLQVLLAVNALLVSAVQLSGGFTRDNWFLYLAGAVFSAIWTFSIGRTSLFQDVWQAKMRAIAQRYPQDSRFAILQTEDALKQARRWVRLFGSVPSRWYLLFSPFVFALAWLAILLVTHYSA
ncbi:MAG: hypothetical protein ACJ8KA_14030 [Sulfurifustis sp.]